LDIAFEGLEELSMKQLNIVTAVGLFPLPLARAKSLKTAKAQAEFIAHHGVWILNVFLSPSVIRLIEVTDTDPQKVASEGTGIEPAPVSPQLHEKDDQACKVQE
jgi:hypothetical protein